MSEVNAKVAPSAGRLSTASAAYDRGSKGYLNDIEKAVRSYDTDNDGKISTNDVFRIVEDVHRERSKKQSYKTFFQWSIVAIVILLVGNFGLVWATVALTKEVKAENGRLEDADTGKTLQTRGSGFTVKPAADTESGNRKLFSDPAFVSAGTISSEAADNIQSSVEGGDTVTLNIESIGGTRSLVEKAHRETFFVVDVNKFDIESYNAPEGTRGLKDNTGTSITWTRLTYYVNSPAGDISGRQLLSDDIFINTFVVECGTEDANCSLYVKISGDQDVH